MHSRPCQMPKKDLYVCMCVCVCVCVCVWKWLTTKNIKINITMFTALQK